MGLLTTLKPDWWFSAHLHVRFQAAVAHGGRAPGPNEQAAAPAPLAVPNPDEIAIDDDDIENAGSAQGEVLQADEDPVAQPSAPPRNSDEIVLSDEEEEVAVPPPPPPPPSETKFLALDKCLPKRQFLEVSYPVVVATLTCSFLMVER
jgi:lariat debranching enzyme